MTRMTVDGRAVLDLAELAELMGWKSREVAAANHRRSTQRRAQQQATARDLPPNDGHFGREPYWFEETIRSWLPTRPGQGTGGGRPRRSGPPPR